MGSVSGDESMYSEKMHEAGGLEERILVSVRLRPLNSREIAKHDVSDWECINDGTLIYRNSANERSMYPSAYTFDRVFRQDSPTKKVYEESAKEVALSVVGGINSSIFAYGQTSSGKTYTMRGVTEFAIQDIYRYVQKHTERTFTMKFSAMEIYNEAVKDLLSADQTPLRLLDDPERGTVVDKLTEETLRDYDHLKELLSLCEAQRQIGETSLNEVSSRSHQIIRLTIESSAREYLGKDHSSTLAASVHFVDLAGSERASQTNSAGARLKEGCHINRSLLTLGTVVRKLSKGRNGHVPYRDSKLTRILQCSLGGNGRTAIICTISPARSHVEQTRNTLSFASCAKEVATNAQVNVVMSDKALVKQLQRQLTRLESELSGIGSKYSTRDPATLLREKDRQIEKMEKEIKELTLQRDIAQSRLDRLVQAGHAQASEILAEFNQYPKLRAPITFVDEPGSPVLSDHFRVQRSTRSQYSSGCSESSFGEYPKVNLEEHFLFDGPSPRLYVITPEHGSPVPYKNWEGITQDDGDDFEELCKDVRCIELEGSTTNSVAASSAIIRAEGEVMLPETVTTTDQTFVPAPQNGHEVAHAEYTHDGVETKFQDVSETVDCDDSSKILNHSRNSSCSEKTLMTGSRSPLHGKEEENENISPSRSEKDFLGTPRDIQENNSNPSSSCISREYSLNSVRSDSSDELKALNIEENQEKEPKSNGAEKSVKDVGLDPMQESPSNWPLEFKRRQKEIIELWHVCHVSLVHRTYFFLLFKGDSSDSIYMEVERRRLSFLKELFSQDNLDKLYIEGARDLTPASSKRALRREREMLSKQIHKKLPKDERETLFQKWGIGLNTKERKLQLAHRLWTNTEDMNHITESANLVAKLVGLEEPKQAFKEMFILSFTPQKSHHRSRSYNWRS